MRPASRLHPAVGLAAGPFVATAIGFAAGLPALLPFLGAAVAFPLFLRRTLAGRPGSAFAWMLYWAVFQSVAVIVALVVAPDRGAGVVHNGAPYAEEMLRWVRTGEGAESTPSLFIPVHARHYLAFAALSVLTAGGAALVLGTWLLNYMNYYVVELTRTAAQPWAAAAMGWHPWAVIRVVGFIATASALAPAGVRLWGRLTRRGPAPGVPLRLLALGVALVLIDIAIKALLAPTWQAWLLRVHGF